MFEYDDYYDFFMSENEIQKRKNFDVFMSSLVEGLTKDLDDSYAGIVQCSGRTINYETLLNNVKAQGFKVFRNSQGKHKLKLVEPEKMNDYLKHVPNLF